MKRIILSCNFLFLVICSSTNAQVVSGVPEFTNRSNDIYRILSPMADSVVKSGELFVSVLVNKTVILSESAVKIYIDDRLITTFVKIQNQKVTMLYILPLKWGKHKLTLEAKEQGETWLKPLSWEFYVGGAGEEEKLEKKDTALKIVELTGNITADYRQVKLIGKPEALQFRQEPPLTGTLSTNLAFRSGKFNYILRSFQTTDDLMKYYAVRGLQSRNYFQTGIQMEKFEALYGDINPSFDKLVLTGTRLSKAAKLAVKTKYFQMYLIEGQAQRANEGIRNIYSINDGFPPGNLQIDSKTGDTFYLNPGTYRRDLYAARLAFGNKGEGTSFGITILKARDDTSSIKYGDKPKDNLVIGTDQTWQTNEIKMKVDAGVAFSVTTADLSRANITKHDLDSFTGKEYPYDPYKLRKIQTFNYSTSMPGKSAMATYITLAFRPKNQILTFDYRYFGGGFQSLGNPFVRVDLRTASVNEQVYIWKRKISVNAKYTFQDNNRSGTAFSTVVQHLVNGNMSFIYSQKAPQLMISYNLQARRTKDNIIKTLTANDMLSTFSSSLLYGFKKWKCDHNFNLQYTDNSRTDKVYEFNSSKMTIMSGGIREILNPINLQVDGQYSMITLEDTRNGKQPLSRSIDVKIRYKSIKKKFLVGGGWQQSQMLLLRYTPATKRNSYQAYFTYTKIKDLEINLEVGNSPNRSLANSDLDYDEIYWYVRLSYNVGFNFNKRKTEKTETTETIQK